MVNSSKREVFLIFEWFLAFCLIGPVLKQQQQDLLASKFLQPQYAPVTAFNTNSSR